MDTKTEDSRGASYRNLHGGQLESEDETNRQSAQTILRILFRHVAPKSILDVGCGLGTWLSVARAFGVEDVQGVEGPWLEKARLRVPADRVVLHDLAKPFRLGRRFDLAICLEVAEHLEGEEAPGFIDSLTAHADLLLFSAAIPLQGGDCHVNEQWPDYWCALFKERGFEVLDFIRAQIWGDHSIHLWLRQNILLFVKSQVLESNMELASLNRHAGPLSIVHPVLYTSWLQTANERIQEHQKLMALLASGGTFSVKKESNGFLNISRL